MSETTGNPEVPISDGLDPEMSAILDTGIFLAAAAKTIEPYNGLFAISLKTQAQGLFDLVNKKPSGCESGQGGCGQSESPEISAEIDTLVKDIQSMVDDPS